MRSLSVLLCVLAVLCLSLYVDAQMIDVDQELQLQEQQEVEWVQPMFLESNSETETESSVEGDVVPGDSHPNYPNPANLVSWVKPRVEDINHRDHRRVHVTLMAEHLDIAAGHSRRGDGVGVKQHVKAASLHNIAAIAHEKSDADPDYIEQAIKASNAAYDKSRKLVRRTKLANMVPSAEQPTVESQQALEQVQQFPPANLAPEAVEERQYKRSIGEDDN